MSNKEIQQVGELVLHDGHSICEIVSDLHKNKDGNMYFMMHNKETKQRYIITIKCEEQG